MMFAGRGMEMLGLSWHGLSWHLQRHLGTDTNFQLVWGHCGREREFLPLGWIYLAAWGCCWPGGVGRALILSKKRWILEAGAKQCAEAHFKSGANITAFRVEMSKKLGCPNLDNRSLKCLLNIRKFPGLPQPEALLHHIFMSNTLPVDRACWLCCLLMCHLE